MIDKKEKLKRMKQKLHKIYMVTSTDEWTKYDFSIFYALEMDLYKVRL